MKLVFELDFTDYTPNWHIVARPSARAIIINDNKVYMIHSMKYDYYEFTGSVLIAYARGVARLASRGEKGCRTVFDFSPRDISRLSYEELLAHSL